MVNQITYRPTQYKNRVRVYLNGKRTPYTITKEGVFYSLYWDSNPLLNYWTREKDEMHQMVQKVIGKKCEMIQYQNHYYHPVK
jgi:Txe/YoeB family toxin of Txe-Axe toxin-antitoxin module